MPHFIVYDNVGSHQGYAMYYRSENFPEDFVDPITSVCEKYTVGSGSRESMAVRCAPLRGRYLISTVFRRPAGSQVQQRGHCSVVNMLLDAKETDEFFREKFSSEKVIAWANDIYRQHKSALGFACDEDSSENGQSSEAPSAIYCLEDSYLLEAALYHARSPISSQLFVEMEGDADAAIRRMIQLVPYALRKTLTFHTNIQGTAESHGVCVCFYPPENRKDLVKWQAGGPGDTNKITIVANSGKRKGPGSEHAVLTSVEHLGGLIKSKEKDLYLFLTEAVTDWDTLLKIAKAHGQKKLKDLTMFISEDDICRVLGKKEWDTAVLRSVQVLLPKRSKKARGMIDDMLKSAAVGGKWTPQKANPVKGTGEMAAHREDKSHDRHSGHALIQPTSGIHSVQNQPDMADDAVSHAKTTLVQELPHSSTAGDGHGNAKAAAGSRKAGKQKESFRKKLDRLGDSPLVNLVGAMLTMIGLFVVVGWIVDVDLVREAGDVTLKISLGAVIGVAEALALFVLGYLLRIFVESIVKFFRGKNK